MWTSFSRHSVLDLFSFQDLVPTFRDIAQSSMTNGSHNQHFHLHFGLKGQMYTFLKHFQGFLIQSQSMGHSSNLMESCCSGCSIFRIFSISIVPEKRFFEILTSFAAVV